MIIGGGFALTPQLALPRLRPRRAESMVFESEAAEPEPSETEEEAPYIRAYAKFLDETE